MTTTDQDGWARSGLGQIGSGPYRISRTNVFRKHLGMSPVYHLFHRVAFLGAFPDLADAKAHAATHSATIA